MRQPFMRQFTIACLFLAAMIFFGSIIVPILSATGTARASLKGAAASIMVITLLLQLAFVLAQLLPAGREAVPMRGFGFDAWLTVIVATSMPGVLWSSLGALAGAPVNLLMPGFVTPAAISLILLIGRQMQQRNIRGFSDRSARVQG